MRFVNRPGTFLLNYVSVNSCFEGEQEDIWGDLLHFDRIMGEPHSFDNRLG